LPEDLGLAGVAMSAMCSPLGETGMLTHRQRMALNLAIECGGVSRRDVTGRLAISGEAARKDLLALVRAGLLTRYGGRRGTRYVVSAQGRSGRKIDQPGRTRLGWRLSRADGDGRAVRPGGAKSEPWDGEPVEQRLTASQASPSSFAS
jgi:hypothetical protein